jgi:hypothetical protein
VARQRTQHPGLRRAASARPGTVLQLYQQRDLPLGSMLVVFNWAESMDGTVRAAALI